jgi:hypothetical protein
MTKQSKTRSEPRNLYCVYFTEKACCNVILPARSEKHAIALAKQRWYRGNQKGVVVFTTATEGWDAELEGPAG